MSKTFELKISIPSSEQELLIAMLYEIGVENFIEADDSLLAYIPEKDYTIKLQTEFEEIMKESNLTYQMVELESRDWNSVWESNFDPILLDDQLYIRASFHPELENIKDNILIAPKMAFGTGHHATTSMILTWMIQNHFDGFDVLDFGCGTGILGIYAKIKGCSSLVMIDNEEAAVGNTMEHCLMNNVSADLILMGSIDSIPNKKFDCIFANITRNVLEEAIPILSDHLSKDGLLVISGFLAEDQAAMQQCMERNQLTITQLQQANQWVMMVGRKK